MHGDSSSLIGLFNGAEYSGSSQSRKAHPIRGRNTWPYPANYEPWKMMHWDIFGKDPSIYRFRPFMPWTSLKLNWTPAQTISPHHHMGFSLFGDDSPRENHEIGLYWTAWRRFTSGMLVLTSVVSKFHVFFFGPTKLTVWACPCQSWKVVVRPPTRGRGLVGVRLTHELLLGYLPT